MRWALRPAVTRVLGAAQPEPREAFTVLRSIRLKALVTETYWRLVRHWKLPKGLSFIHPTTSVQPHLTSHLSSSVDRRVDYSFLVYGENFETAEINGEKLLNITQQKLNKLGIILIAHQDIILKAFTNIYKKVL
ncbi:hypothetical protein ABFV05_020320 [Capra hircus]